MVQRMGFMVAAGLVTFTLVLVGGVALRAAQQNALAIEAPAVTVATLTPEVPAPIATLDPDTVKAQIDERDRAYQQAIETANRQLQEANERLHQAYQQQQRLEEQLRQAQERMQAETQTATPRPVTAPAPVGAVPPPPAPARAAPPPTVVVALAPAAPAQAPARPTPTPIAPDEDDEDADEPEPTSPIAAAPVYPVTPQQAAAIALTAAPGATVQREPELVSFRGTPAYEVVLDRGQVYIDATSGRVLHNGAAPAATPAPTPPPISAERAAEIARAYLKRGTVASVTLGNERGVVAYMVTFTNGSKVYVNAATGEVIYAKVVSSKKKGTPGQPGKPRDGDDDDDSDDD